MADNLKDDLKAFKNKVSTIPEWRLTLYSVFFVLVAGYLAWAIWGPKPQQHSEGFKPTKPAVSTVKVPGPVVKVPIKIVPKKDVEAKHPEAPIADSEEWVDTVDVPPAKNGAVVLTKIETQTGEVSSLIEMKPAPWFALERTNILGAAIDIGTRGQKGSIYYKRDIFRIKDAYLQLKPIEIIAPIGGSTDEKLEIKTGAAAEWRF